jgi:hypothetical protein
MMVEAMKLACKRLRTSCEVAVSTATTRRQAEVQQAFEQGASHRPSVCRKWSFSGGNGTRFFGNLIGNQKQFASNYFF